jgi:GNAT superfamily N-acetyltransferase
VSLDVRRVTPDEWDAYRDTRLAALADAPSAFLMSHAESVALPEDHWRTRAAEGGTVLAWRDGRPVGIAAGHVPDTVPELVAMWVAPEARGSGVVEGLVEAVAAWAAEGGASELRLWVVEHNERAAAAYRRCGFVATGRSQPLPVEGRTAETEAEMSLDLRRWTARSDRHVQER